MRLFLFSATTLIGAFGPLLLDACSPAQHPGAPPVKSAAQCPVCSEPKAAAALGIEALQETSGLAASKIHKDLWYAHNDSGDSPRVFAMSADGQLKATFALGGAFASDWEDMARGPCQDPKASCIYVADMGDNKKQRNDYKLYRFAEPEREPSAEIAITPERFDIRYPDGAHNAEALLVHPVTGHITIVTKTNEGPSPIYEFTQALSAGTTIELKKVGEIAAPKGSERFTGGAVHPNAKGILLRTYSSLWYYPMSEGQSVAQAISGPACALPVADEAQGETVEWLADGSGYLTISEGVRVPINRVDCKGL